MTRILIASLLLLPLAACGGDSGSKSTAKLDAVEVQPGSISDSMIILDDADGDGTAVDNSVPNDGSAAKEEAKPAEESAETETTADGADSEEGQMISAPVAKKAPAEEKK